MQQVITRRPDYDVSLYRGLIRCKTDSGSFVYGSATKSKLFILDPVLNTGFHLATIIFLGVYT